jgi:hypothetical protein
MRVIEKSAIESFLYNFKQNILLLHQEMVIFKVKLFQIESF